MNLIIKKRFSLAFTIIELIISIVAIGILASITVVSYSGWQRDVVETQVKNDLSSAAIATEGHRNFNSNYPLEIPVTFKSSEDVTLDGGSADGGLTFCIVGVSDRLSDVKFHISSTDGIQNIQFGECPTEVPTINAPTVSAITPNTALLGATISSSGTSSLTSSGICWGLVANPISNCQNQGANIGTFTMLRTGMPSDTLIYFRGYATNSVGTSYSADGTFNTAVPILVYRATVAYDSSGSTTAVVDKPGGTINGDLIFVIIERAAAVAPSGTPTGWTLLRSNLATYGYWLYYKIANNEPASWTWTWAASVKTMGRSHSFFGNNITTPIQSSTVPYSGTASGTVINVPTLTTSANNTASLVFASGYSDTSKIFDAPVGWTKKNESGSTSPDFWQSVSLRNIPTSGTTTGVLANPMSASSTYRVGIQVMINLQ